MTILEMLGQSGLLTLLGMCVVFSFIIILIICMGILQKILHSLHLDKVESKPIPKKSVAPVSAPQTDVKKIVAAIAMAIKSKEN